MPLTIRTICQPRANSDTVALARGPLIYCVEDVDNPWVKDHFKSVHLDLKAVELTEESCDEKDSGYNYIALKASGGVLIGEIVEGILPGSEQIKYQALESVDEKTGRNELRFVPYYARANRGGRYHMRVGLKVKP
jgi:DUF1680 family protein